MTLEPSSPLPRYHQLERVPAERIAEGRDRDGFPGDHELAAEFSVGRGTVRQVLEGWPGPDSSSAARPGVVPGRAAGVSPGHFYHFAPDMQVRGIPESSRCSPGAW